MKRGGRVGGGRDKPKVGVSVRLCEREVGG